MRIVSDAAHSSLALPVQPSAAGDDRHAARLLKAAGTLLGVLERGAALDARTLREAMTGAFGATDSEGAWVWKDAYEACEAAQLLFLRRHFLAMRGSPRAFDAMVQASLGIRAGARRSRLQ
jgi:hypothetical protein